MASTFDNYPVRLLNGNPWPKNSPAGYTGWTTLATGVARSINTVAVQVVEKLGLSASYKFATENLNLDLSEKDKNTASLGLGGLTDGVNTEEMAGAYASFANDGVYNEPHLYTKVTDADGNTVLEKSVDTHVAMKETTAYFMNELLQGVVSSGTGTSARFSNMEEAEQILNDHREALKFDHIEMDDKMGKVSIVGAGLMSNCGVAAKMFEALYEAGINIQMINTSEIRVSVLLDEEDVNKAVKAIHAKFFDEI